MTSNRRARLRQIEDICVQKLDIFDPELTRLVLAIGKALAAQVNRKHPGSVDSAGRYRSHADRCRTPL